MKILEKIKQWNKKYDILPKFFCVLLAVGAWLFVNSQKIGSHDYKIPVEYTNLSADHLVTTEEARYLTVTVKGKKEQLNEINRKNIKAQVNLYRPVLGKNSKYKVKVFCADLPDGLELSTQVKTLAVTVEKKVTKKIQIIASIEGSAKEGYLLGEPTVSPNEVTASGPKSVLKSLSTLQTEKISLQDVKSNVVKEAFINTDDFKLVTTDLSKVNVNIPVINVENLIKIKKNIEIRNPKSGYKYELANLETTIYLQKKTEIEKMISSEMFEVFVNVADFSLKGDQKERKIEVPVMISVKDSLNGVKILSYDPSNVEIVIKKEK